MDQTNPSAEERAKLERELSSALHKRDPEPTIGGPSALYPPTAEGRLAWLREKYSDEIREAERAAREERDREWAIALCGCFELRF